MSGDRGIDALVPKFEDPGLLSPADFAYWEVLYTDGSALRETDGQPYSAIDRSRLASFRIIHGGEPLIEMFPPPGATGYNLVYRRRTHIGTEGRRVVIMVAWPPMGPIVVIDPAAGTYREERRFDPTDMDFAPPQPMPGEPQDYLLTHP